MGGKPEGNTRLESKKENQSWATLPSVLPLQDPGWPFATISAARGSPPTLVPQQTG